MSESSLGAASNYSNAAATDKDDAADQAWSEPAAQLGGNRSDPLPASTYWIHIEGSQGIHIGDVDAIMDQRASILQTTPQRSRPVRVGVPPLLVGAFQPRADLREQIDRAFSQSGAAIVTQVLQGDAGTGKTQLAAATYQRITDEGVELAVWITASSRDAVLSAFAHAADVLALPVPADDPLGQAETFLAWLSDTDRTWLIVLDDIGDPGQMRGLWPQGVTGRVLVTSRRRDVTRTAGPRVAVIDVGVFTPQQASSFLAAKLDTLAPGFDSPLEEAGELAADLGYLPVALAQAASVILDDAITCGQFRERLADRQQKLADLFPESSDDQYGRTLAATWALALERADTLPPAGVASRVAVLIALLDPNGCPESVLLSDAAHRYIADTTADDTDINHLRSEAVGTGREDHRRGIRNLHRLNVITHNPAARSREIRIHALAQRAILEQSAPQGVEAGIQAAAKALLEIWPRTEMDLDLSAILRQNTARLTALAGDAMWSEGANALLFRAGRSLGRVGQVETAVTYWHDLHTTSDRVLGPDHVQTLIARSDLASWRGHAGDPAGASHACEELLDDQVRVLGPDHRRTLRTRHNVAYWRGHAGDAAGAVSAFECLLTDRKRVLGPEHPSTLNTRHTLADWQGHAGAPDSAVSALSELLLDRRRILGIDHPRTLTTRHDLAFWRGHAGDPAGAVVSFEELLVDRTRVLGPDHPRTLLTRHELADWRGYAGDPAGAVRELSQLLVDRLRVLGPSHPHTLVTQESLAFWLENSSPDNPRPTPRRLTPTAQPPG